MDEVQEQIEKYAEKAIIPYIIKHKGEEYEFEYKIRYKIANKYLDPYQVFETNYLLMSREIKKHCNELKKKMTYEDIEFEYEQCITWFLDLFINENTEYTKNVA